MGFLLYHSDGAMLMLERPLMFQYHESSLTMTLIEVAIFTADLSLASVDLRSLESPPFQERD